MTKSMHHHGLIKLGSNQQHKKMAPLKITFGANTTPVSAVPLDPSSFGPFGEVLQNPHPHIQPSPTLPQNLSLDAISANQGTAIKYQHPSKPLNLYAQAPSNVPGKPVLNMFVCATRALDPKEPQPASSPAKSLTSFFSRSSSSQAPTGEGGLFDVKILERHPFTTQTFVPLSPPDGCSYLVVVAPSLPPSEADEALPVPSSSSPSEGGVRELPGRGLPDLSKLRAFVATGDQAVTYGAGTWHAPMVALGPSGRAIDFVVSQFANGVADEDVQEVEIEAASRVEGGRLLVDVPGRQGLFAKL